MFANLFSRFAPGPDPRAIDHDEFEQAVRAGKCVVVDVREAHEFALAHIPKSLNMPLSTFNPQRLPDGKPVVLICHSGMRSRSAVSKAHATGREDVKHYAGGILGWHSGRTSPIEQVIEVRPALRVTPGSSSPGGSNPFPPRPGLLRRYAPRNNGYWFDRSHHAPAQSAQGPTLMAYNISRRTTGAFNSVVARVKDALKAEGFGVLTEIDVAGTLKTKIDRASGPTGSSAPAIRSSPTKRSAPKP